MLEVVAADVQAIVDRLLPPMTRSPAKEYKRPERNHNAAVLLQEAHQGERYKQQAEEYKAETQQCREKAAEANAKATQAEKDAHQARRDAGRAEKALVLARDEAHEAREQENDAIAQALDVRERFQRTMVSIIAGVTSIMHEDELIDVFSQLRISARPEPLQVAAHAANVSQQISIRIVCYNWDNWKNENLGILVDKLQLSGPRISRTVEGFEVRKYTLGITNELRLIDVIKPLHKLYAWSSVVNETNMNFAVKMMKENGEVVALWD
ncbi:hypothetical protein HDV00_009008 [Rhizophlyctis rosea]|nr:hypothetical protein HDV00_009008 [Rhizophlyctis rosea]